MDLATLLQQPNALGTDWITGRDQFAPAPRAPSYAEPLRGVPDALSDILRRAGAQKAGNIDPLGLVLGGPWLGPLAPLGEVNRLALRRLGQEAAAPAAAVQPKHAAAAVAIDDGWPAYLRHWRAGLDDQYQTLQFWNALDDFARMRPGPRKSGQ